MSDTVSALRARIAAARANADHCPPGLFAGEAPVRTVSVNGSPPIPVVTVKTRPIPETNTARLVRAAETLPQPFTFAQLVVAAWRMYGSSFSLDATPYPDSHRIMSYLCGQRSLIARGLLNQVGPKLYRLPEGGAANA